MTDSAYRHKNVSNQAAVFTAFVRFVLDQCLEEFVQNQFKHFSEVKLPFLQSVNVSLETALQDYTKRVSIDFLEYLSVGDTQGYIQKSLRRWKRELIKIPGINPVGLEDILGVTAIRKRSLSALVLKFTRDIDQLQLINETSDQVFLTINLAYTKAFEETLRNNLYEKYLFQEQQKLKQTEELYKQAQALNKLGNWNWDIKSDNLYWSDELFRIYGLEPQSEKLSFERFVSFVHPDDREKRMEQLQNQLTHPGRSEYYFRINAADGKLKILYGQSEVLRDEQGIPAKIVGTCQDVTKQKELETSLYQKTVQLEKSNESLQQFAYICSHDLKEPLRKISILGDRLSMLIRDQLNEQSAALLSKIISASMRLHRMIDDVLSVSIISADTNFAKEDLSALLDEVLQNIDLDPDQAKIEYKDLPQLLVNHAQFKQLFQNLITNSIKFKRNETAPHILIQQQNPTPEQVKRVGLDDTIKYTCIHYRDNGIGFEPVYSEKIFGMFQRLHGQSGYEGTGIGLTICKRIVENHHGGIFAESEPGKGSSFYILVPAE